MSSKNEIDPGDLTPEQRHADWQNRAAIRERIRHGVERFGADRFHAFLAVPDVDLGSETLHEDFVRHYNGSYLNRQRALEGFIDRAPLATVLRYYLKFNEPSRNAIELNYDAISGDFDRWMHAVEMGDRIYVFWRLDTFAD